MTTYSSTNLKYAHFSPPKPIEDFPQDSIKKMAVLFTDIVGSTRFFKAHGDIAGRKMLSLHQEMSSRAIADYGGVVVKFLGDSAMAYFFNPSEALKSAIRLQQIFHEHNQGKEPKEQIHIRICIHFGGGIVEEHDIFGDVVNTAAKFLPLADGDQIFISQEVLDQVKDLPSVRFNPVPISSNKDVLKKLTLFSVIWDATIRLEPITKHLIFFKPIWELSKKNFNEIWSDLLKNRKKFWSGIVEKESILADRSIALIVKDSPSPLVFIKKVLEFLKVNLGRDGVEFLPVQIIIDTGPFLLADKLNLDELKVNWKMIDPGQAYISSLAYDTLKKKHEFPISPVPVPDQPKTYHRLTLNGNDTREQHLFQYQKIMIQGDNPPCFYCGDRRHLLKDCPSKQITEITHIFRKLGYLPFDDINSLFLQYLSGGDLDLEAKSDVGEMANPSSMWAHYAFHELTAVFQLRLFRTIWNDGEENWHKVKDNKADRDKGGLLWIAQDCIRVSNLEQAESILSEYLEKKPEDYVPYCAMGLLNVEKNDYRQAKFFFKKALDAAKTTPQITMIMFLQSRLEALKGDTAKALERIRKIRYTNQYCTEAVYQDIAFKFREDRGGVALQQLLKLIDKNREYFIIALIDPQLAPYSDVIHPKLREIYEEAKKEAVKIIPQAKREFQKMETLFGKEEKLYRVKQRVCWFCFE